MWVEDCGCLFYLLGKGDLGLYSRACVSLHWASTRPEITSRAVPRICVSVVGRLVTLRTRWRAGWDQDRLDKRACGVSDSVGESTKRHGEPGEAVVVRWVDGWNAAGQKARGSWQGKRTHHACRRRPRIYRQQEAPGYTSDATPGGLCLSRRPFQACCYEQGHPVTHARNSGWGPRYDIMAGDQQINVAGSWWRLRRHKSAEFQDRGAAARKLRRPV